MKRGREPDLGSLLASAQICCVILDLDSTVWSRNCEDFSGSHIVSSTEAVDPATGRSLHVFPDVHPLFEACQVAKIPVAIASASPARETAARLLQGFGLKTAAQEVHPGSKAEHLQSIAAALRVPLTRALFFDDLRHNISAANKLGIGAAVLVGQGQGLTEGDVRQGIKMLRERGRGAALMQAWMRKGSAGSGGSTTSRDGGGSGASGAGGSSDASVGREGSSTSNSEPSDPQSERAAAVASTEQHANGHAAARPVGIPSVLAKEKG